MRAKDSDAHSSHEEESFEEFSARCEKLIGAWLSPAGTELREKLRLAGRAARFSRVLGRSVKIADVLRGWAR